MPQEHKNVSWGKFLTKKPRPKSGLTWSSEKLTSYIDVLSCYKNSYEFASKNCFSSSVRSQYAFLRSVARRFALDV